MRFREVPGTLFIFQLVGRRFSLEATYDREDYVTSKSVANLTGGIMVLIGRALERQSFEEALCFDPKFSSDSDSNST